MSNHTPGPWLIVSTYVRTAINTAQGIHVAMVNWWKGISVKEHEANARLIAAAPDMLEALEWLSNEFDCRDDEYGVVGFTRDEFRKAEAAIRKARGEV